jgi:hypothetical protein
MIYRVGVAGTNEVVTKLNSGDGRRTQMLSLTLSGFGIERSFAALYYECFNGLFEIREKTGRTFRKDHERRRPIRRAARTCHDRF